MKIAVTGARGGVGRDVVKHCAQEGHQVVQVNRTDEKHDGTPNSEMRTADTANSYEATVKAFHGCDAVIHLAATPDPIGKEDWQVHQNNVQSAFNGFRACGELGIKKICFASSVNAIGLAFANQPLKFAYFPIDEEYPLNATDSYALAKEEAEVQGKAFARWFPGTKIAMLRIHEVASKQDVLKKHREDWENAAVKQLWSWVNPEATARACLLAVTKSDNFEGCEIFNVVAPTITLDTPSKDLASRYYPEAEIRGDMSTNVSFWTSEKIKKVLGWDHPETE